MSERLQKLIFVSVLAGALVPLAVLALTSSSQDQMMMTIGLTFAILACGWAGSLRMAHSVEAECRSVTEQAVGQSRKDFHASLAKTYGDLKARTNQLITLSDDQQSRAMEASTSTARATENATIIASAIEEMNSAILEIGRQADEATSIAKTAADKAQTADTSASSLSEKSDNILSIVELIRTIAERTNLLALNATIEAARAGEHGKGFAVVANEVKTLAKQTAEATTRIETQINEVRDASHGMKGQMADIEATVAQINSITQTIKNALHEETTAAHEISRSATETTNATNAVTTGISRILVTTEEMRRASIDFADHMDQACKEINS